jgi:hypothetical protein
MPYFSSPREHLDYLKGDAEIHVLSTDGLTSMVTRLPVGALQHAGFAVSPDNRTGGVAIIDYAVSPHHLRVYSEDLLDDGGHHELLTSTVRFEWPIAFVGSDLLMAVGPTGSQGGCGDPYRALYGYRLLHADGTFVRSLCAPPAGGSPGTYGVSAGPVNRDGALCAARDQFV